MTNSIIDLLSEDRFGCAYYRYAAILQRKEELKQLSDFKRSLSFRT
jgi:hypothetical protein